MHAKPDLQESTVWCECVLEDDRRCLWSSVESKKVEYCLSIVPCLFSSQYLRVQGVLAVECLLVFLAFPLCSSMDAPCLSSFWVREPFSSSCYAQKFVHLSLALGDAPPTVPSSLSSDSSCKHSSVSSKREHLCSPGVSAYLFSVAEEAAWFSEVGEHIRGIPLYLMSSAYIFSSLLLSFYQYVGHLCSDFDTWMEGVLQPCSFPWCVVMFF